MTARTSQPSSTASNKSATASDASSPPINTPEIKPSGPENGNLTVSPMLDAISASTNPSVLNEWARGGMAGSPGNLISLMGESPPTQPSSYEDPSRLHHGWAHRNFMTPSPASPSPPNRRPLSFHMDGQLPAGETPPRTTTAAYRRSSLSSPFAQNRLAAHPPLPHQPQAHFYGAPDLDMHAASQPGLKAGDHGLYFGFDSLPRPGNVSAGSDNVVVAGYNGGLDVYTISKRGLEPAATLKGLRGTVHNAKILPWTTVSESSDVFPLIAVVVHGPVAPAAQSDGGDETRDGAASPRSTMTQQDGLGRTGPAVDAYQTTVEVYSLKSNKLVDVLLEAPKIPINPGVSITSSVFQPPPPTGSLSVKADAGNILVCCGTTGEIWVYSQLVEAQSGHAFACTGKLWTCLQHSYRSEVPEEQEKTGATSSPARFNPQTPIVAMNGRWIAYCPAAPSSQMPLRAHLPVPVLGRAPGVASMTPPHLPQATAAVDLPISDSMVNKIMRETTQELIQGAKWVGQQGLQAWNSYWNKSASPQSQQQQARSPPQPQWAAPQSPRPESTQFPPTHGTGGSSAAKDPGLVAILDVNTLPHSQSTHHLATFVAPGGCSFLSFSPSSLNLFTASTKGDVQTVWDLLRVQHTHSSPLQASVSPSTNVGTQVRQIAQFSRMTVARIVDVSWTGPHEERIAMVTERGTVHLLDMPFSAFMWPPPRRRKIAPQGAAETSEASSSAVSIASGAIGAAYHVAKPFVSRSRRGSSNNNANSATTTSTFKDTAAQGGRVIAASISSSLGKTGTAINQLRHNGENRVALPSILNLPTSQCVSWLPAKKSHQLFALGGGLVRRYPNKMRRSSLQPGKRAPRQSRYKDMAVPLLPDERIAPVIRRAIEGGPAEEHFDFSDAELDAGNTLTLQGNSGAKRAEETAGSAIPQAEIETSAPYQPFHTDRRVAICEYTKEAQLEQASVLLADTNLDDKPSSKKKKNRQAQSTSGSDGDTGVWAFGQDIPNITLDMGGPAIGEDVLAGPEDHRALPQSAMERLMQVGDEEQIVVTTRRRRGARHGDADEDGFFEDDCEVLDFADQRV